MGIQCALCHSTVDDSFAPGIGHRRDGWAPRDLNVGAIIALAPNLQPVAALLGVSQATLRSVLNSWGPGKYDAAVFIDGTGPRRREPAHLDGVGLGHPLERVRGQSRDARQGDLLRSPAERSRPVPHRGRERVCQRANEPDLVRSKLAALHVYQLAIPAPAAPEGPFDKRAARRGEVLFRTKAQCAVCHVPPLFTEPGWNMHRGDEIGIDNFQADRSPDQHYRTAPLKGLWSHQKGGFYHDGRFATLRHVVDHYNSVKALGLTGGEAVDLVEYLKSL